MKILYAFHWSVMKISMDAFLLLTGHLNIVQFTVTINFVLPWHKQLFFLLKMVFSQITSHSIVHVLSVFIFPILYPDVWGKYPVRSEKIEALPYTSFSECIIFINNESTFFTPTISISISEIFPFHFSVFMVWSVVCHRLEAFLCQTPFS